MSTPFEPSRQTAETYDNAARGLRIVVKEDAICMPKEYEKILADLDSRWAKQGEP
jgi:hypothetical protein